MCTATNVFTALKTQAMCTPRDRFVYIVFTS